MALDFERIRRNALRTDAQQYPGQQAALDQAEGQVARQEAASRYVPLDFARIQRNAQRTDQGAVEGRARWDSISAQYQQARKRAELPLYDAARSMLERGESPALSHLAGVAGVQGPKGTGPVGPVPQAVPQAEEPEAIRAPMGERKAEVAGRRDAGDYGPYRDLDGPGYTSLYSSKPYYGRGNIDLGRRPLLQDGDGIATVRSMSFEEDGKEVLVPTVIPKNGQWQIVSDEEAIDYYRQTGQYLGKFGSVAEADAYAQQLHQDQEAAMMADYRKYGPGGPTSSTAIKGQIDQLHERISRLYIQAAPQDNRHRKPADNAQELYREAAQLQEQADALMVEWEAAKERENEELRTLGWRDASVWDLLGKSFMQGYYNSMYGVEAYKDMTGQPSNKEQYADILGGEDYRFITDSWLEEGISGAAALGGQQVKQWTDPRTVAMAGTGAVMGGMYGSVAPGVGTVAGAGAGMAAGFTAGSMMINYEIEAGLAYDEMIHNGIEPELARKIALVVGGANAALEGLQVNDLLKSVKILNKNGATQGAAQRLLTYLGHYAAGVGNETLQEVAQEGMTIAGVQAAQKMQTGDWAYSADQVTDRLKDTAVSSALSFGVARLPGAARNVGNIIVDSRTTAQIGAQLRQMDPASVEAVLAEGLESGPETASYKIASELRDKLNQGGQLTNEELGALYRANVEAVAQENAAARDAETDARLVRDEPGQVAEQEQAPGGAAVQAESGGRAQAAQQAVPYHVMDQGSRSSQAAGPAVESMGRYGQKALETIYQETQRDRPGVGWKAVYDGVARYYDAGVVGLPMERVRTVYGAALTQDQRFSAYMAGTNDAAERLKAQREAAQYITMDAKGGGFVPNEFSGQVPQAQADTLHAMGRALGVKITFADSVLGGKGNGVTVGGVITIARDAANPVLEVARHEITHELSRLAPDQYRAYRDYAVRTLTEANESGLDLVGRTMELYRESGIQLTREEAMDELAADLSGKLLTDRGTIDALIRKDRTLAQRFHAALQRVAAKVRAALQGRKGETAEYQQTAEQAAQDTGLTVDQLTQAAKLWDEAFRAASEKAQAGAKKTAGQDTSGGERYSLNAEFGREFDQWMENTQADRMALSRGYFRIGTTSEALKGIGVRDGNIYWRKQKIGYIMMEHPEIDAATVKSVPEIIEHPIIVMKSLTREDSIVLFGDVTASNGERVMAALELTPRKTGGMEAEFSLLTSAYGRSEESTRNLVANSEILYLDPDKKRTDTWLMLIRVQFPSRQPVYGSIGSIRYEDGKVNISGKTLSELGGVIQKGSLATPPSGVPPLSQTSETSSGTASTNSIPEGGRESKYSLKDAAALEQEVARLTERNKALMEQFRVSKGARMDPKAVAGLARDLLGEYGSRYDRGALEQDLHGLFGFIANGKDGQDELTYRAAKERALGVARKIVEQAAVLNDESYQEYKGLRDHLRGLRLVLAPADRADLDMVGGYDRFRKDNFGRFTLGADGVAVDTAYKELAERWPEFFGDDVTHPADMLVRISDVLDGLMPIYENPYAGAMDEAAEFLALDMMERFYDVPQAAPTFAEKAQRRLADQVIHDAKKLDRLRAEKNARIEAVRQESREKVQAFMAQERERRYKAAQKLKEHYADMRQRERTRRNESAERTVLLKVARKLDRLKTTPQNRAVIDGLIGDLDLVSKGITGQTVSDLQAVETWYRDIQDPGSDIYDPDFLRDPYVENAIARLKKKHIAEMDMGDVRELTQVLLSIEHEIRTDRQLLGKEERRDIYHLAEQSMMDIRASRGSKAGSPLDAYNTLSLSALREFRRLVGYREDSPIYRLAVDLNEGQRKMLDFQMRASKLFDDLVRDKKTMERFTGAKAREIALGYLKSVGGEPVAITPAMRVSLYLHSRNDQNLLHIKVGGVVVPDMALYRKGLMQEAYARGAVVKLRPSEVRRIVAGMSAKEKAFADRAYQFFNSLSKQAINETSLTLNGYEKAMVDNYFPIRTSRDFTRAQFESLIHDGTIEGMGILKEREVRATNPVVLEDVTAVLMRQIDNVGRYYGLAVPVRNFEKVWSVTTKGYKDSTKSAVSQTWGPKATRYVEDLMTDLQNGRQSHGSVLDKARGNFAQAVLAVNISVTMKQAASYPTAAGVLGWRPLVRAFGDLGKVDRELVGKYTPLLWYREQGGSTTELGDVAHRQKWADKMPALMGWIQKADVLTVAKLWKASEYYVQEHNKDLGRGTDAYYKAVAKVFDRVVEETQPNYTVMQRPDVLRSPNQGLRAVTMFSTQRLQNYNMVYDAVGDYRAKLREYRLRPSEANQGKLQEARRGLARTLSAQFVAAATISAMTLAASVALGRTRKYEDDEEDEITTGSLLAALGDDFLATLAGSSLFGADLYNALKAALGGQTWYDVENPSLTMLNDVVSSFKSFFETAEEEAGMSKKLGLKLNDLAVALSKFVGVPLENVEKITGGIAQRVYRAMHGELLGRYYYLKATTDTTSGYGKRDLYDLLWQAKDRDPEAYEEMYEDMVADGFDPDSIKAALNARLRNSRAYTSQAEGIQAEVVGALEGSRGYLVLPETYQEAALEDAKKYAQATTKAELTGSALTGWMAKAEAGERVGIEPWEYILYRAALDRYNEGADSITQEEAERAIDSLPGLSRGERAYLWRSTNKAWKADNNPYS